MQLYICSSTYMQLHILTIPASPNNKLQYLHPVVLQTKQQLILIDCGYAGTLKELEIAFTENHIALSQLTGILITHHDIDHLGALKELKDRLPALKVYATAIEKPYIEGSKKSLRLQQAEESFDSMPAEYKPWAAEFIHAHKAIAPVEVNDTVPYGVWPLLPAVEIIHTPGHMPGHISFYIDETKTLIAADAVVIENDLLNIANPQFTLNMEDALNSVEKLATYPAQQLICYHGGLLTENIAQQLQALVARYRP